MDGDAMAEIEPTRRRRIAFGPAVPINTLPEILEAPFPERRTVHWMSPDRVTTDGFSIVVSSEVLLQTSHHVAQTLDREQGGFLLGNRYRCKATGREYLVIDQCVAAEFTESTAVSLTFTHEAWGQIGDKLSGKFFGKKLVGWYHSHPRMSIFLSEYDLTIHRERFAEPWMVALVLEPQNHLGGFFARSGGRIDPNRYCDFYELLDGEGRESVVAWRNYEGVDHLRGEAPVLSAVNTAAARTSGVEDAPGPTRVPVTTLPGWLQGNAKWYGAAVLALALLIVYLVIQNRKTPTGNEIALGKTGTQTGDGTTAPTNTPPQLPTITATPSDAAHRIDEQQRKAEEQRKAELQRQEDARRKAADERRAREEQRKQEQQRQLEALRAEHADELNALPGDISDLQTQINELAARMLVIQQANPKYKDDPEYQNISKQYGGLKVAHATKSKRFRDLKKLLKIK
jgi:proteasome lid subunit RPN8/RPN11